MSMLEKEIVMELTENFDIDKDYVLNYMFEKYPALMQVVMKTLGTNAPELRGFINRGGFISSKVVAHSVLGIESLHVESSKLGILLFRVENEQEK